MRVLLNPVTLNETLADVHGEGGGLSDGQETRE